MTLAKAEEVYFQKGMKWWPDHQPLNCQFQHAAVIRIRDHMEVRYNREIPIYFQDPNYVQEDVEALKKLSTLLDKEKERKEKPSMTIVNADFGY
jgi:SRR1 domain